MIQLLSIFEAKTIAGCVVLLAVGIFLVVKGGDWFVDAASWIAEVSGIPTFIIGATIVSVATTLPEILVSSISAAEGNTGLAIGNAVGSVNCNIALILAISLLFIPAHFKRKDYAAKMVMLLVAISTLWAVSATGDGTLHWWEALIVLMIFIAFMAENIYMAKKHSDELVEPVEASPKQVHISGRSLSFATTIAGSKEPILAYYKEKTDKRLMHFKHSGMTIERKDLAKNLIMFVFGAGCIVLGAQLMCDNGSQLALDLHVPQDIIGVTILAVGTSLPELVTTITAIIKKKSELSIGNIIGANVIDISLILPLCAFISAGQGNGALPIAAQTATIDFPFCLAVAGFTIIPALIMGRFKRFQGGILLAAYITYIILLVLNTLGKIAIF